MKTNPKSAAGCWETSRSRALAVVAVIASLAMPTEVFAHGGDATLVHACVNTSTKATRIVGKNVACASNETPYHWANAARTVAGENRIKALEDSQGGAVSALVIKDSQDQVVGKFLLVNGQGYALRKFGNTMVALGIYGTNFFGGFALVYYYTTPDCSGTAYLQSEIRNGLIFEIIETPDNITGYYPQLPAQQLIVGSYQYFGQDCQTNGTPFESLLALPVSVDLSTLAAFPVRLE